MNQKKVKALRKVLKNLEKNTAPENLSALLTTTYTENKQNRKQIWVEDLDEKGEVISKQVPIAAGTVTVNKNCRRGLYKHLKKNLDNQK